MVGALMEQEPGAVATLLLLSVQDGLAENDAENCMGWPFAGMVTFVKV